MRYNGQFADGGCVDFWRNSLAGPMAPPSRRVRGGCGGGGLQQLHADLAVPHADTDAADRR
jgi:hypothetical protein